jgi:ferredoxin
MANLKKRVPENVPGDFFVDSTCIDCDACRQIAPATFAEAAETSFVRTQPVTPGERRQALHALLSCPTGSIGCLGDDDPRRYAKHFGSRRIIHRTELASQPGAELVLDGPGPWQLGPDFLAISTPGHTKGHCVVLFRDRFLFTGDHLDWDRHERRLAASKSYCWYSWPEQIESMARLAEYRFEWVLPGHGQRVQLPATTMHTEMTRLVEAMAEPEQSHT